MAVLQVRLFPDPILRQRALKVTQFDAKLARLAADMMETMAAQRGVGLAANQVGVLQRLCVVKPEDWDEPLVLVNPEVIRREGEREVEEGCLSVPGYRGMVVRSEKVQARALDLNSKRFKVDAENDLLAQALEHEIDHLNGIMYMDHLVAHTKLYPVKEAGEDEEGEPEEGHGQDHHHHRPDPGQLDTGFDALHRRLHDMNLDEGGDAPR